MSAGVRRCRAPLAAAVLLIASCATVPKDYPRTESTAFQFHESTSIGKELAGLAAQHPGESGVAIIRRGRPAFNSLASSDVIAAFAGYSKRREAMVRNGIELYELRPEPGPVRKRLFGGGSKAGLHTTLR